MDPEEVSPPAVSAGWTFRFSPEEPAEPTVTIIEAVAWLRGVDQRDLTPLGAVIDADALAELATGTPRRSASSAAAEASTTDRCSISFEYEGCLVTVESDQITIEPADGRSAGPE